MSKNWGRMEIRRITSSEAVLETKPSVAGIFETIVFGKQIRAQQEIIQQLQAIHSRVQAALEHFGMSGSLVLTEEEMREEELRRRRPPGFITTKMKQEMLEKQNVLDTLHEFGQTCLSCERNMEDVHDWLYDVQVTLEKNTASEDDMKAREKEVIEMNQECSQVWADGKKHLKRHCDKLRRLGREIFEVLNELTREQMDQYAAEEERNSSHHVPNQPFDKMAMLQQKAKKSQLPSQEQMLKEAENWKSAAKDVESSLDQACRMARTNNDRMVMRNAVKQFNFMSLAMERRNHENSRLSQDILECECKINHVTKQNEKVEIEIKKKTQRLEAAEGIITKANNKISDLQTKVKEAKKETTEVKTQLQKAVSTGNEASPKMAAQLKEMESERNTALENLKKANEAMTKMTEDHEKIVEELEFKYKNEEDTARKLERVIENLEAELRESLQLQEEYAHQLDLAEFQKQDGKNRSDSLREQYKNQMKDLKKDIDDLHREISSQRAELDSREETIVKQEQRIADLTRQVREFQKAPKVKEVTTNDSSIQSKQRIARIRQDYEEEINKLKDYLEKERQRTLAEKRRQEADNKTQLANIHKESIHLTRAINRFKESIAILLEKESLLDTAHEIRQMDNLVIEEKVSTDLRRVLNQMAGNALELLVSLESKLAQALMNKRIELKEALLAKQKAPATPPAAECNLEADKLQQENQQLQERIIKYQEQMNAAQVSFEEMKRINEEKYNSLLDRHKAQILHATSLQRELRTMEATFREEMKKRDAKLRNMRVSAAEQERNQQVLVSRLNSVPEQPAPRMQKPNVEQIRMKVSDQMKNLSLLEEAFKENKISLELHTITVDIINQTMEVPEMRLRSLFERYITFRRLQEQKDELCKKLSSSKNEPRAKHQQLTNFLERMEKRMTESINKWREKRETLKKQRTQLYEQMFDIFDAVSQEAGIRMIRPVTATFKPYKPPSRRRRLTIKSSAVHMDIPHSMKKESVLGTSMALLREPGPFWRMPVNLETTTALVTVPRMLDMDVNTRRKAAQDVLLRLGKTDDHQPRNLNAPRHTREPSLPPIATMFPPISS
ncbi:uncharacterized protein [Diadema antillarum]|uniref:uncharacterized protein n=2 Tax=Diadema antillarum TaxID=105358 RepID=UPI003A8ADB3A